jgi:non-specific serine/threonine protein kinase/serine/threonine-protein kinase
MTVRERLELFLKVCDGVRHAHQRALIHRDLKSSNILVFEVDGRPVPRIIDFGLAKAMGPRLTEHTFQTALGELLGTPAYMSPEQATLTAENVDTRTDVYSLGVVLYRLLTGDLPHDPKRMLDGGFEGLLRVLREEDPQRPSERTSSSDNDTDMIARRRGTGPRQLVSQLEGDLDWITMRALEKDRERRYGSVGELAEDIQRHLRYEPVLAGPPSRVYQTRKFVRRHRMAVALASLGSVAVVVFVIAMAIQSARVAQQATYARQVSDFMTNLFVDFDPADRGSTVTFREVLDEGAARAREELAEQPLVQARMMMTIGGVYRNFDLYEEAEALLLDAVEIYEREAPKGGGERGEALVELALHYRALGDNDRAEELLRQAIPVLAETKGTDHTDYTNALHGLAVLCRYQAKFDEAESLYLEVLEIRRRALGEQHEDVAKILSDLSVAHYAQGRYDDALDRGREALTIRQSILPGGHVRIGESYNNLGVYVLKQGDYEQAREYLERALAIRTDALGPSHNRVGQTQTNLGRAYEFLDDLDAALEQQEAALSIFESTVGEEHWRTAEVIARIAGLYRKRGDFERAMQLTERAHSITLESLGAEHPAVADNLALMGRIEADRGKMQVAEAHYWTALEILEAALDADSPRIAEMREEFAGVLEREGRTAQADSLRALDR